MVDNGRSVLTAGIDISLLEVLQQGDEQMTEAELWGLIVEYNNTVLSTFALYLTLITGFLIVAFLVGEKLTKRQAASGKRRL